MSSDEYRHLTFLFCDLENSTPLSQKLDHEDWRLVLSQFQQACVDRISFYGGYVHERQGDGLLAYFGYPEAREDNTVRAVRAGLRLIDDCKYSFVKSNTLLNRSGLQSLRVRVGVHSGSVLVGQLDGRQVATGFPLAFTERLHKCAEPNTLVVSGDAYHLVSDQFRCVDLGRKQLKGIEEPASCYQVLAEVDSETTDETHFVDRKAELATLDELWSNCIEGHGGTVEITGEAGIGKSRLVSEFVDIVQRAEVTVHCWKCTQNTMHSALVPIVHGLRRFFKLSGNLPDSYPATITESIQSEEVLAIERLVKGLRESESIVSAVTSLLSMGQGVGNLKHRFSTDQQKNAIIDALINWILSESERRPVLLVVEDVRWIDPSTMMFLNMLRERVAANSVMVVLTYRTESDDVWSCKPSDTHIDVKRLTDSGVRELVSSFAGSETLSESEINQVVTRSDGVPLYVEESTAILVSKGDNAVSANGSDPPASAKIDAVPTRLMDLLAERLDRVGEARKTAGFAAIIGREFSAELLRSVSDLGSDVLRSHLDALSLSGLVKQDTTDSDLYAFKHALVCDAAYAALLKSTRRSVHLKIAKTLQIESAVHTGTTLELIAYHYTEALEIEPAVDAWLHAARIARLNSNPMEAIYQYKQVLRLLENYPESVNSPKSEKEFQAQIGLGGCFIALEGYGSTHARLCYETAETIALDIGAMDKILKTRFGLQAYYFMRGDFELAFNLASDCHNSAEEIRQLVGTGSSAKKILQADITLAQACWASGAVLFHLARFDEAIPLLTESVRLCENADSRQFQLVQSPVLMSKLYLAWYDCESGNLDEALVRVNQVVNDARQDGHSYTLGVALAFSACIHIFRYEYTAALIRANESIENSKEPGFKTWLAWARVLRGRALSESESTRKQGLAEIREGLKRWDESGAVVTRPFALTMLAEALHLDHNTEEALVCIDSALDMVGQHGERYFEAEILTTRGVLLLGSEPDSHTEVEQSFRASIEFANARGLARPALRASIELCRLLSIMGKSSEGKTLLVSARKALNGGARTSDVLTAEMLLHKLEGSAIAELRY